MTEDTKESVRDVFKSDMKTAELMKELVEEHNLEDVSDLSVEVVNEMYDKIEEPHREKALFATCFQIGNAIGSQQLAQFAAEQLERWEERHG